MPGRLSYEDINDFISKNGDTLISIKYINGRTPLEIQCGKCKDIFKKAYQRYKQLPSHDKKYCGKKAAKRLENKDSNKKFCFSILHPEGKLIDKKNFYKDKTKKDGLATKCKECSCKKGKESRKVNGDKNRDKQCPVCKKKYKGRKKQVYCSTGCQRKSLKTTPIIKQCLECKKDYIIKKKKQQYCSNKCGSRAGGRMAAANRSKRSKGEVYFEELCEIDYGDEYKILSNAPIFDGWDADIIIEMPFQTKDKEYNGIAICYNGVWHYKQLGKKHKLKQVQSRDKIKAKIIKKHNYFQYIVKDMGKFNRDFVEEEFYLFKAMIDNIKL